MKELKKTQKERKKERKRTILSYMSYCNLHLRLEMPENYE
jgi:hypothetical protein